MTTPTWKTTAPTIDLDTLPAEPSDASNPVAQEHSLSTMGETTATDGLPTFDDPAAFTSEPPKPVDIAAEKAAYTDLIDLINAHKDDDTTVTLIDIDTFSDGLE